MTATGIGPSDAPATSASTAATITAVERTRVRLAGLIAFAVAECAILAWLTTRGASAGPLAVQGLVVFAGLAAAAFAHRRDAHRLRAAEARERHASAKLQLAADLYWEQDCDFRFTHASDPRGLVDPRVTAAQLGHAPWELGETGMSEAQFAAHRADLEAHRAFSGLLVRRQDPHGRTRVHRVSGEPRFGPDGRFDGYWGVSRDVTEELRAQGASASGEARYRELFERSPSPLYLHRRGIVYDANVAAARLFGFDDAAAMYGTRLVDLFQPGEAQEQVVARIEQLESLKIGEGVPVADFHSRAADGRPISVQATGVRVDSAGGAATLSILYDITARLAAETALRRSEAMLSHLFATSPDCIALSELESGRHLMVNPAFCKLTGYSAEEVVGRTAAELGLWHNSRDRDRLRDAMLSVGHIDNAPASILQRSGQIASVLVSAARFTMEGADYAVVNARDVTESERTRREHAVILERASIGIALTRDRVFVQANPRWEAIFGWVTGSLAGQSGATVWVDAADYAEIGRVAGPLLAAGEPFETEREMRRHDGSRFWCRILGQAVDPLRPSHGGTIWIADDVTERR
ncbi:MAG: PAS domain S-box protein, partial [Caldimonas sp.]